MDFRTNAYLAAMDNVKEAGKYKYGELGYWANLVCAAVNGIMALPSDDVVEEVHQELDRRRAATRRARDTVLRRKAKKTPHLT